MYVSVYTNTHKHQLKGKICESRYNKTFYLYMLKIMIFAKLFLFLHIFQILIVIIT